MKFRVRKKISVLIYFLCFSQTFKGIQGFTQNSMLFLLGFRELWEPCKYKEFHKSAEDSHPSNYENSTFYCRLPWFSPLFSPGLSKSESSSLSRWLCLVTTTVDLILPSSRLLRDDLCFWKYKWIYACQSLTWPASGRTVDSYCIPHIFLEAIMHVSMLIWSAHPLQGDPRNSDRKKLSVRIPTLPCAFTVKSPFLKDLSFYHL